MTELLGIDMSEWQRHRQGQPAHQGIDRKDFEKIAELGPLSFSIQRLSLGEDYQDPTAIKHLNWAEAAHVWTGGYHFLTTDDGYAQAENFIRALDTLGSAGIAPDFLVLDIEEAGTKYREVCEWLARFRKEYDEEVLLYGRESFFAARKSVEFQNVARLFDREWWADYRSDDSKATRFLANDRWHTPAEDELLRPGRLWQWGPLKFTDADDTRPDGSKPLDAVDGNVFLGNEKEFAQYVGIL